MLAVEGSSRNSGSRFQRGLTSGKLVSIGVYSFRPGRAGAPNAAARKLSNFGRGTRKRPKLPPTGLWTPADVVLKQLGLITARNTARNRVVGNERR